MGIVWTNVLKLILSSVYSAQGPRTAMLEEILSLVRKHEDWRVKECINLIPSENVTSPAVCSLLSSDLGHRYTSTDGFYMGTRFTDQIELYGEKLAKEVFDAETADLRPLSGHVANWIFLSTFTKPNDKILCVSAGDGGYPGIGKEGLASLLRLHIVGFPFSKEKMNVKIDETIELISREKPRVLVFGASLFLFPHPVKEIARAANEVEATIAYDGSHVLGLIAGKTFQQPLKEGASVLYGSTHKSFFGPQGGLLAADRQHGESIKRLIHPMFVDNAHWNRIAALTLALAETKTFGKEYARQVVRNAQSLAKTLYEFGFPVKCADYGFTQSHQVWLDYGGYKQGKTIAKKLEKVNITVDCGVRLGTCEVTRRGMKEGEMEKIAEFMKRLLIDKERAETIKGEVKRFIQEFQQIKYCFSP
jgi:glycine hydroxymethyltransferase